MLVSAVACATESKVTRFVKSCQAYSPQFVESMEKSTFGQRLKSAFNNATNAEIARKIGVSDSAVTNYMAGRVPDIEKLTLIKSLTNCGLDWLLTGEEPQSVKGLAVSEDLKTKLNTIAKEQAAVVYADLEIAGENVNDATTRLLTEYLLDRALRSFNLVDDSLLAKADRKRAEKFTFVSNVPQSVDDRIREIVEREMSGKSVSPLAQADAIRDMIRELIKEEVGGKRGKNLLITHDFGEGKEPVRKAG